MQPKKSKFKGLKTLLKLGVILGVFGIVGTAGVFAFFAKDLPNPDNMQEMQIAQSTKIYDRTGKVILYEVYAEHKRTILPEDQMPKHIKNATIVAEDDEFYKHHGIDLKGIARSVFKNVWARDLSGQGGSTITQQLIKNLYLSPEKTLPRKIKEAILAIEIEFKYSKDEILSFYLNAVPYGSNAYGIEAASQQFFAKPAKELTISQSAVLAAMPKAPTYYSPFGNNPEKLEQRHHYILKRMYDLGYITEEDYNNAVAESIVFTPESDGIRAPHFVMYVREYLEEKYGEDNIKTSGLNVITTLDWELQQEAQAIVAKWAEKNDKAYGARNAALVAIDPSTGQILAMVGSRDYNDLQNDGNVNVTIRPRQPGSSFKPFVYAKAFEKG